MFKFLIYTFLVIVVLIVGWRYLPEHIRNKTAAFIGLAARGNKQEVKRFVEDVVLPKDIKEKRKILLEELKKNITELKGRNIVSKEIKSQTNHNTESATSLKKASTDQLIGAAGGIIKELEDANNDESIGQKITERIIDAVLPSRKETAECVIK